MHIESCYVSVRNSIIHSSQKEGSTPSESILFSIWFPLHSLLCPLFSPLGEGYRRELSSLSLIASLQSSASWIMLFSLFSEETFYNSMFGFFAVLIIISGYFFLSVLFLFHGRQSFMHSSEYFKKFLKVISHHLLCNIPNMFHVGVFLLSSLKISRDASRLGVHL